MNPFRRCIVLDVWAVEVLLRSVVVWGVEDFPGVEAAYVNADTRAAAARRGGGGVEVLFNMWGEFVVYPRSGTPVSYRSDENSVVCVYG